MPRSLAAIVAAAVSLAACGGSSSSPGGVADPPTAGTPTGSGGTGGVTSTTFAIEMPLRAQDGASDAGGVWPFGVHGADHGADGHPGWDLQYALGANVLAVAAGTVQSTLPDGSLPGAFTVQLQHKAGGRDYRTVYGHVGPLAAGIAPGASVALGQALGGAFVQTRMIGSAPVTYASIHFQVDDFTRNEGLTNPNAVNPEVFLGATGKATFDQLWANACYRQELVEPFPGNSRLAGFPMQRTWTLAQGTTPARIDVRAASLQAVAFDYTFLDAQGAVTEAGTLVVTSTERPPRVDFTPAGGGPARLGIYDVVSGTWTLALGAAGAARPASLASAASYATK